MSFNIKQIRNTLYADYESYLAPLVRQTTDIVDLNDQGYIQNTDSTVPIVTRIVLGQDLDPQESYFLRFSYGFNYKDEYATETTPQNVDFKIILKYTDQEYTNQQTAGGYSTEIENGKKYQVDFFISPNSHYGKILFELSGNAGIDLNKINNVKDGTRYFPLKRYSLYRIKNLLEPDQIVKRIRVEGDPGLKMCINREQIIIPPSGIFEITKDYPIDFFGFMIGSDTFNSSSFIVNYQY